MTTAAAWAAWASKLGRVHYRKSRSIRAPAFSFNDRSERGEKARHGTPSNGSACKSGRLHLRAETRQASPRRARQSEVIAVLPIVTCDVDSAPHRAFSPRPYIRIQIEPRPAARRHQDKLRTSGFKTPAAAQAVRRPPPLPVSVPVSVPASVPVAATVPAAQSASAAGWMRRGLTARRSTLHACKARGIVSSRGIVFPSAAAQSTASMSAPATAAPAPAPDPDIARSSPPLRTETF